MNIFTKFITIASMSLLIAAPLYSCEEVSSDPEEIRQIFLRGKLVYNPNPKYEHFKEHKPASDGKIIEKPISDLPKEGTFNLEDCGDAAKYLIITSSLKQFFEFNTKQLKFHILVAKPSIFNEYLSSTQNNKIVDRFKKEMVDRWNGKEAPIGIFMRRSDLEIPHMYYLKHLPINKISSQNLFEFFGAHKKAYAFPHSGITWSHHQPGSRFYWYLENFSFVFPESEATRMEKIKLEEQRRQSLIDQQEELFALLRLSNNLAHENKTEDY